ncbi:MAG: polysaccharide deacetylase family protein [Bacteroidales bacterium]|nr:polysaccharide deacetylase family protein [Bacteroidales bacterium]
MKTKLKLTLAFVAIFIFGCSVNAQTYTASTKSSIPIEMLLPQGKSKALILSFDDGNIADRHLVKLMNEYGLIGTFHLNSNKLGTKDYLTKEEIKNLYKGHEVSGHSANHPSLPSLSKVDVIYEVLEDRRELERLISYPVRGMSYPFGNTSDLVIEAISGLGIEYARTVGDTYNFNMPTEFLKWQPSIHLFGKTNYIPNDTANDRKELGQFYQLTSEFLNSKSLALFYVWGHSWEYEGPGNKWAEVEKFFKMISNNPEIYYTTQIDLVDYINAFNNLRFSVDKTMVTNPASITVYVKMDGKAFAIEAGSTTNLKQSE